LKDYCKSLKPSPSKAFLRLFLLWFYTFVMGLVIGFAVASLVSFYSEGEGLTGVGVMIAICSYSFIYIAPSNLLVCALLWWIRLTPIVFDSAIGFLIEPVIYIFISLAFSFLPIFYSFSPVIKLLLPMFILGASLIFLFKIGKKD
ncbi:MAG: hypothetical protein K2K84_02995, partial [Muribaculaceae bacterium]|nr:hypothetical protein [Muribaculaceae bacterium]